jgi:O-antigen/teichoic acid export membrane protein
VLLGRVLGAEQYGIYSYALSWAMLLAFFSRMGLDNTLIRFIAVGVSTANWGEVRGLLRRAGQWALACGLCLALVAGLVVAARREQLEGSFLGTFWVAVILIPLFARVQLQDAAIRGLKKPALAALPDEVVRPLLTATGVAVLAGLYGVHVDATIAMAATGCGALVALVFATGVVRKAAPSEVFRVQPDTARSREWLTVALSLLLLTAMNVIQRRADTLMLGMLVEPVEVGLYGAASRYAFLVTVPLQAINAVVAPLFAEAYAKQKIAEIQRLASLAAVGMAGLCLPIGAVFFVAGEHLLLLFGAEFRAGFPALAWLTAGQLANVFAGSVMVLLMMTGHQRAALVVATVTTLTNIGLNLVLIPRFGAEGAAMANAATKALKNAAVLVFVVLRLRVDPSVWGALRWGGGRLIRAVRSRR